MCDWTAFGQYQRGQNVEHLQNGRWATATITDYNFMNGECTIDGYYIDMGDGLRPLNWREILSDESSKGNREFVIWYDLSAVSYYLF